jgi:polar amino acid transport system substrate-binding protein
MWSLGNVLKKPVIITIGILWLCNAYASDSHLSLVTAALPPLGSTPQQQGFLEQISREAFGRIGYSVEVHSLPGERALINVNSGIDDGDLYRAPGFESAYPNLIQVPEKIGVMDFMAYTKDLQIENLSWQDLEPHVVAYANGWKIYERKVKASEITVVRSINELIPLLENSRAEIILMDRWQGLYVIQQQNARIKLLQPPLAQVDMYMYLNKRHKDLVSMLARAIRDMKQDGTYQKIYDNVFKQVSR